MIKESMMKNGTIIETDKVFTVNYTADVKVVYHE